MKQGLVPHGYSRHDIIEGYYWWLYEHYDGQWSKEYIRACKVGRYFKPSIVSNGPSSEQSQEVYEHLCQLNNCKHDEEEL